MIMGRFLKQRTAAVGLILLLALVGLAIIGPTISGYSSTDIQLEKSNQPPGAEFWFGSDDLGRDLFTRVWMGARISLFVGCAGRVDRLIYWHLMGRNSGFFRGECGSHFNADCRCSLRSPLSPRRCAVAGFTWTRTGLDPFSDDPYWMDHDGSHGTGSSPAN